MVIEYADEHPSTGSSGFQKGYNRGNTKSHETTTETYHLSQFQTSGNSSFGPRKINNLPFNITIRWPQKSRMLSSRCTKISRFWSSCPWNYETSLRTTASQRELDVSVSYASDNAGWAICRYPPSVVTVCVINPGVKSLWHDENVSQGQQWHIWSWAKDKNVIMYGMDVIWKDAENGVSPSFLGSSFHIYSPLKALPSLS